MTHPYVVSVPYIDTLIKNDELLFLQEDAGRLHFIYKRVVAVHPEFLKLVKEVEVEVSLPIWKYLSVSSFDYELNENYREDDLIVYVVDECTVSEVDAQIVDFIPTYSGNLLAR